MEIETLAMKVGESTTVELPGPKGAGYGWTWRTEGAEGVIALSRTRAATPPASAGTMPPSGGPTEWLTIEAVKLGEVRVHLTLQRSFEPGRPPLAERILDVQVR